MNKTNENNKQKILQEICLKQNIPFVSYRLPNESSIISLVQQYSTPRKLNDLQDIDCKTGFIVSPFTGSDTYGTYFLEPDSVHISNDIKDKILLQFSQNSHFLTSKEKSSANFKSSLKDEYIMNVNTAKCEINQGSMDKVVLSNIRKEELTNDFSAVDVFERLCSNYPHAFVYLMQIPEVGSWMGATPEQLLVVENEVVKTVSLAGTQVHTGLSTEKYHWKKKEIQEQAFVTDYVEGLLRSLKIENIIKTGPENYQAANLIHLKTSFEFPKKELRNQFSALLEALHPTPSVGGLPKIAAQQFVFQHEKHDRAYYTGFLGPVNIDEKIFIFVNLRCIQLFEKQFVLYSGAGITSSSVAENEWIETQNKMLTMLNVIHQQ